MRCRVTRNVQATAHMSRYRVTFDITLCLVEIRGFNDIFFTLQNPWQVPSQGQLKSQIVTCLSCMKKKPE